MSTKHSSHRAIADAGRDAAAKADHRAISILNMCATHGRPLQQAAELIGSGKSLEECEAAIKRSAAGASWAKAMSKAQGGQS